MNKHLGLILVHVLFVFPFQVLVITRSVRTKKRHVVLCFYFLYHTKTKEKDQLNENSLFNWMLILRTI